MPELPAGVSPHAMACLASAAQLSYHLASLASRRLRIRAVLCDVNGWQSLLAVPRGSVAAPLYIGLTVGMGKPQGSRVAGVAHVQESGLDAHVHLGRHGEPICCAHFLLSFIKVHTSVHGCAERHPTSELS